MLLRAVREEKRHDEDSKQGTERSGVTEVRIRSRAAGGVRGRRGSLANGVGTAVGNRRGSIEIDGSAGSFADPPVREC
jgi:hypothetical protein